MTLPPVDRVSVTTVVDNSVDILRPDEKVARRWGVPRARKIADLRAEHGLAHHVEVARGPRTARIAFDFGLTAASMTHNFQRARPRRGRDRRARAEPRPRRSLRRPPRLPVLVPAPDAAGAPLLRAPEPLRRRWMERDGDRVSLGRLDRGDVARWDVDVVDVAGAGRPGRGRAPLRGDARDRAVRGDPAVAPDGAGRRARSRTPSSGSRRWSPTSGTGAWSS